MFATCETVDLAEWIIDDYSVFFPLGPNSLDLFPVLHLRGLFISYENVW